MVDERKEDGEATFDKIDGSWRMLTSAIAGNVRKVGANNRDHVRDMKLP